MLKPIKEDDIQKFVVEWLNRVKPNCEFHHSPNQQALGPGVIGKVKAMGMRPGFPDLMFWGMEDCPLAYVELKTARGTQSRAQEEFELACLARNVPYELISTDDPTIATSMLCGYLKAWGAL